MSPQPLVPQHREAAKTFRWAKWSRQDVPAMRTGQTKAFGKKGILALLTLLLLAGAVITYKLVADSPDERFAKRMENSKRLIAEKEHELAINELKSALSLNISEPSRKDSVAQVLCKTRESWYVSKGNVFLDKGKLVKARDWYENVLAVNPHKRQNCTTNKQYFAYSMQSKKGIDARCRQPVCGKRF